MLKEYSSLAAAARETGISQDMIGKCATGACKMSFDARGMIYKWHYVIEKQRVLSSPILASTSFYQLVAYIPSLSCGIRFPTKMATAVST
jgi:hypothetical protein